MIQFVTKFLAPPAMLSAGVSGGNLAHRVAHIMTRPVARRLSFFKRGLLTAAALAVVAVPTAIGAVFGPEAAASAESAVMDFFMPQPVALRPTLQIAKFIAGPKLSDPRQAVAKQAVPTPEIQVAAAAPAAIPTPAPPVEVAVAALDSPAPATASGQMAAAASAAADVMTYMNVTVGGTLADAQTHHTFTQCRALRSGSTQVWTAMTGAEEALALFVDDQRVVMVRHFFFIQDRDTMRDQLIATYGEPTKRRTSEWDAPAGRLFLTRGVFKNSIGTVEVALRKVKLHPPSLLDCPGLKEASAHLRRALESPDQGRNYDNALREPTGGYTRSDPVIERMQQEQSDQQRASGIR